MSPYSLEGRLCVRTKPLDGERKRRRNEENLAPKRPTERSKKRLTFLRSGKKWQPLPGEQFQTVKAMITSVRENSLEAARQRADEMKPQTMQHAA
ncbi:hypothetical protein NDU88_008141 [Pleurodeles waltl]|uniref:Uncharacterized protein n=1 Tax=Pleurodeles waltl TaxID=8319 RepID=A0AAV7QTP9_PLEWA|nr:hypothetical protein NDU88_008141 [Pleurodeles waltl]